MGILQNIFSNMNETLCDRSDFLFLDSMANIGASDRNYINRSRGRQIRH